MMTGVYPAGLLHSEICGSPCICHSPQLIAAYHVLLRLPVPRHSPCALSHLTFLRFEFLSLRELFFLKIGFFRQLQFFYPNFHLSKLYFAFLPLLSRLYSVFKVLLRGLHYLSIMWWAQMGSNHRPRAYQARALAY